MNYTTNNIVDIGEVARHCTIVVNVDRLASQDGPGKLDRRHVRPSPWAVDGEKPQPGRRHVIEMAVGMRHQLVRLLRRGIKRGRMIDTVMLAEGHLFIAAIDG